MKALLFLLLFLFATQITATTIDKKIKHYRIGVTDLNHFPLFDFNRDKDKGIAYKILEAFADKSGYKFDYVVMNTVKLQDAIEKHQIDFIFPDNPKWRAYRFTREHNIFSLPFVEGVSSTFVTKENENKTIDQIASVAIPYGYSAVTWYASLEKYGIETLTTSNLEASLLSLYRGNVMAADIEYNVAMRLLDSMPNPSSIVVNSNLPATPVEYHLSTVKHILVIERFSHFVKNNPQLMSDLLEKYNLKTFNQVFQESGSNAFQRWTKQP